VARPPACTAKYAADCLAAFGMFAHRYRCYWQDSRKAGCRAYRRTRDLFRLHIGADMPGTVPGDDDESDPNADCWTGASGCILAFACLAATEAGAV
jgi:hypothetical protein